MEITIKNLWSVFQVYKDWWKIRKGEKIINQIKGSDHYVPVKLLGARLVGRKEEWEMGSGKIALVELVRYETFIDHSDMVKESFWHQSGYKGEQLFKEMSFKKYLKLF